MALEIEECRCVEPNRVLAITRAHGAGAGSGVPVASGRFAQVADFRDGRVVKVRLYGDVAHALEAVGLQESPPHPASDLKKPTEPGQRADG